MTLINVLIPTISMELVLMIITLIPVIAVEAFCMIKILGVKDGILKTTIISNLLSTLLGIPIAWIIRLIIGMGVNLFQKGGNYFTYSVIMGNWPDNDLKIFVIISLIIIVAYIVSVISEYWISKFRLKTVDKKVIWKGVWIANLISYTLIVLIGFVIIRLKII